MLVVSWGYSHHLMLEDMLTYVAVAGVFESQPLHSGRERLPCFALKMERNLPTSTQGCNRGLRLATFQLPVAFQSGDANEQDTPVHKSLLWLFPFLSEEAVRGWVPLAFWPVLKIQYICTMWRLTQVWEGTSAPLQLEGNSLLSSRAWWGCWTCHPCLLSSSSRESHYSNTSP